MMLRKLTGAGAAIALIASTNAFADTRTAPMSAKQVAQIMQLHRAHVRYGTNANNAAQLTPIILGVVVGGAVIAGAVVASTSSGNGSSPQ